MSQSFPSLFPGMLLESAERFAQDHAGAQDFGGTDPIAGMGWACTVVPEEFGGVGGTLADLGAIVEGLASHGVQLPVVERCAVAPILLQAATTPEPGRRWLEALAEGSAAIAPLASLSASLEEVTVQAKQLDIGFALEGEVTGVDASLPATHWLVPTVLASSGETAIFLVDAERMAPTASYRTMEGRRGADFKLDGLTLPAAACIARGHAADAALQQADNAALMLTAADTVAALAALIRQTITHLKERRQFGVALSTFQVLRHRLADMYVRYLGARGLVVHAFEAQAEGANDLRRTLRLAKVALAETARACAEAAIQTHGGMGMSEEVLATRLAQRLLASEFRHGDRLTHAARLLAPHPEPASAPAESTRSAR